MSVEQAITFCWEAPLVSSENTQIVHRYYEAIRRRATGEELAGFYDPEVIQEEYPNRFLPNGARRDLNGLREAAARGRDVMTNQEFEIVSLTAQGDTVVVEARWAGTVAKDIGPIAKDTVMRAHFAQFFQFRDGRIISQRNYDCFDPW